MGYGFAFLVNQYKVSIPSKDYYIDLLFYYRKRKCLVAIELKIGSFLAEYDLKGLEKPMGVEEYKLTKELPKEL